MEKLLDKTIGAVIEENARCFPLALAVKYTDRDYQRSWQQLNEEVDRYAKGFLACGIGKGDHVAIWATNIPEWLITLFATAKIGAVLVTVNTSYKVFEVEYLLRQSDSKAIVLMDGFKDTEYVDIINKICPMLSESVPGDLDNPMLPCLKTVIHTGTNHPKGMVGWDELESKGQSVSDAEFRGLTETLDCNDVINMQYTSGTTGFPKGVMLTHRNIVNNGLCIGDCMKLTGEDKLCIPVPFFHCFGLVLAIMACITHHTAMVPITHFRALDVLKAVQDEECTALHGVPTMFISLLEHPDFSKFRFPKLRTGIMAGSPCPVKVMQQVVDVMGAKEITIAFGQTESSPVCTQTTTDDTVEVRVSTVGRVLPMVEAKIVDPETGEELGPNMPGEFCTRGYHVMKGYYKMEEATAQAIDKNGWLHTGDIATVDKNGYYNITGRIKDMIIRGGENIYPKEIEEFLYTHPMIKDVQVIAVPSIKYGEEVAACIVLKDGAEIDGEAVKEYVRERMARHKVPSYVAFVESFPMTASGKVQKYKLREWAIEEFGLKDATGVETA